MLTFAEYCLARNFMVELFWHDKNIVSQASQRFNLNLSKLKVNFKLFPSFRSDASYAQKIYKFLKLPSYDLVFFLSDGSIPFLNAKNNWLHFQVPFQLNGTDFKTQQKLTKINQVICNSDFTRSFIGNSFHVKAKTIYPPVSLHNLDPEEGRDLLEDKQDIILSVGRFDQILNAKRQDVLIQAFKKLVDEGLSWKLYLAGGLKENEEFLLALRQSAIGYPIEFFPNIEFRQLKKLYHNAKIYWHATGFDIDENKEPQKVEHFGMSIVEAMYTGSIPMVCAKGGPKEIISDKQNGYLWESIDQLVSITANVAQTQLKQQDLIINAQKRALDFSKEKFFEQLDQLFNII